MTTLRNGLYAAKFGTMQSVGHGVVIAKDGQFRGGDNGFYYTGHYETTKGAVSAHLAIDRHAGRGKVRSVFGVDRIELNLEGEIEDDTIRFSAFHEGLGFTAELSYICE